MPDVEQGKISIRFRPHSSCSFRCSVCADIDRFPAWSIPRGIRRIAKLSACAETAEIPGAGRMVDFANAPGAGENSDAPESGRRFPAIQNGKSETVSLIPRRWCCFSAVAGILRFFVMCMSAGMGCVSSDESEV